MTDSMRLTRSMGITAALLTALAIVFAGWLGYLVGSKSSSPVSQNFSTARVDQVFPVTEQPKSQSSTSPDNPEIHPAPKPKGDPSPVRPPVEKTPPEINPDPPRVGVLKPNVIPAGKYKKGDVINQNVTFTRKSLFRTVGVEVSRGAQYGFSSSIHIANVEGDGSFTAEQTIRKATLIDVDRDMKAPLTAALDKAQNTTFKITVAPNGEVTSLIGPKDPVRILEAKDDALGQSLRMWSLLDADAWKELAGLTFFQPDKPLTVKATWNKPVFHDWSPLGSWRGKTVYVAAGKQPGTKNLERIQYSHDVYYKPQAAGVDKTLPFQVLKAEFKTVTAGGVILYDPNAHRSTAAEETFHVRGGIQVSFAGVDTVIEMEERQGFRLIVNEPAERTMVGKPSPNRPNLPK